jgi:hypothetical protein
MTDTNNLTSEIFNAIASLLEDNSVQVIADLPLVGADRALNSMKLIELCILLEDMATDIGFEFDWTSDLAMSKSQSIFRTAGALATEFLNQMETQK